jgi:hypothetical protein
MIFKGSGKPPRPTDRLALTKGRRRRSRGQLTRGRKAVCKDDVDGTKQQRIGQVTATVHESGEYRFVNAKAVG